MVSFPYYSHIFRDSCGSGMGIVWETYQKGVPLLGVPENPTDECGGCLDDCFLYSSFGDFCELCRGPTPQSPFLAVALINQYTCIHLLYAIMVFTYDIYI